jgi:hypothetical protein
VTARRPAGTPGGCLVSSAIVPGASTPAWRVYPAAIERAETRATDKGLEPFAKRVEREAKWRGFDEASRKVAIGDGTPPVVEHRRGVLPYR